MILHDRSLPATPIYTGHTNAYHSFTGEGTPYCYCLVFGQNLNVADNNHNFPNRPNDKVYAHILSHEIAEMVVDPFGGNPEVCDGCAGNCNNIQFDLFDQNGAFIGGTADTDLATGFSFFINSIISPAAYDPATQCAIQAATAQPRAFIRRLRSGNICLRSKVIRCRRISIAPVCRTAVDRFAAATSTVTVGPKSSFRSMRRTPAATISG